MDDITRTRALQSRLLLLCAALLFSTGGAAIKAVHLSAWQVACFRSALATIVLMAASPSARQLASRTVLFSAPAYAATVILFVLANKLTTAANAILLQSAAPLYLLLAGPLLLKEPVRRSDVALLATLAAGMVCILSGTQQPFATAPDPARGNVFAVASGLAWATTLGLLRHFGRSTGQPQSLAMVTAGNILACLLTAPVALPASFPAWHDVLVLLWLGVFQISLAYICLTRALRRLTALQASLMLLIEPALNPLWSWLVHGERPGPWTLAGGALILAATVVYSLRTAS